MKRTFSFLASAALVVTFATGCGGDSDGRPSVDEISDGISDSLGDSLGSDVTDDMVNCIAKAFHDSDLSDEALQALADGDDDYEASDDDEKAIASLQTGSMADCAGEMPDMPELDVPEPS